MFVQPSSLVFLVLIAIWAAYLLQHWVRRREHLATARSVDRFSDAMRVLERRTPLPESALSTPHPRSYAVSPARPSRPEVVVKRAQSPTPDVPTRPAAAVRPTRIFHVLAGVSARRLRGLSLLASLSLPFVVSVLAALSVVSWWIVLVAVAVLVADVAWLRHAALSDRAARREQALARGSEPVPARAAAAHFAHLEPEPELATSVAAATDSLAEAPEVAERVDVADVAVAAGSEAEVDPSGWAPIPVPPPTYTLKAMAERPMSIPEFVELTEYAPVQPLNPDGQIDENERGGVLDNRRAAGA